jgi:hypothetical protein
MRWLAFMLMLVAIIPATNSGRPAQADTFFPQTGYNIWGPFEEYWQAHGGLEQFGLPRTSVYPAGNTYDAQWFERALFTYDPSKPDPYKVELNLLGSIITESRRAEAPFKRATPSADGLYFEPTGHNLAGIFLQYWQQTGGLAIYGYPVSEAFTERSKSDGKSYLVQYFERNRFELHPEAAGTRYEVQLGLLGSELLDAQGGPQAIAKLGLGKFYPRPAGGIYVPPGGIVDSPNAGTPEPVDNTIPAAPQLPPTTHSVFFTTDFSSSDLSLWRIVTPYNSTAALPASWAVKDGVLRETGVAGEEDVPVDALLLTKSLTASEITLDAFAYPTGGEPLGLVVRWSNSGYYVAKLYPHSDNNLPKASIVKVTPQGQTTLAQSQGWPGYTARQWHAVGFTAKVILSA